MKSALWFVVYGVSGTLLALLSTFVGERSAFAAYPEIMGCEMRCAVVATGWPLTFVRDYPGMSVVNTATILEVWLAADRFDWPPFLFDVLAWSLALLLGQAAIRRLVVRRPRGGRSVQT